jgi:DNA-binding CsgD family transcriptional regulator/tetratricopeptide (TPR) repeat protein
MSHSPGRLVGRDQDLAALRAFADRAAADGGALVMSGEAGVGKTALVEAAASYAAAAGRRVLRVTGAEFEVNVSFAGLHQLLFPLLDSCLGRLGPAQREALRGALGLREQGAPDWMTVALAALELLTRAAAGTPVLIVVDDVPWLDVASGRVLAFIARRASGTRLGFLATMRTGDEGPFDRSGIGSYELGPLSPVSSQALLDSRHPALPARARCRLLTEARGNPLALLELPAALGAGNAPAVLGGTLPLTGRLQEIFAGRISGLPARARHALLLAALEGTGDLAVLRDSGTGELAPAAGARLVVVDDAAGRVSFRHPLIRSAVVELASGDERRDAHRILAGWHSGDPDRHAWHLAEASHGPDEAVAVLLQEVAHANVYRGDSVSAIRELLRAADLSPAGADRAGRLAEAAGLGGVVTGDLRDVPALLDAARRADPRDGGALAGAVAGAYHLLNEAGDIDNAHRLLAGAIELAPDPGDLADNRLAEALYTLLMVAFFGGRAELWPPFHAAVARLRPGPSRLLSVLAGTFSDPARLALPVLRQLDDAIGRLSSTASPVRIVRTALAGSYLDRLGDCREPLWRAVRHGREGGAVTSAIEALFLLGSDAWFTGRWDEVIELADEGLALCQAHGYSLLRWVGQFLQALVATARGDQVTGRELTGQLSRWAAPRRVGVVSAYAWHVRTLDAIAGGAFEEAYRCASAVSPAGQLASHVPHALWLIMELVESAARSGRRAEAAAHVAAARDAHVDELSPRLALVVAGAAAMAAPDGGHQDLFEQALSIPGADRWPFDLARVQLAYGEQLRRDQSPSAARTQLRAAADGFERLGARPWASRADSELRATGIRRERHDSPGAAGLTAQQSQIAQLAAAGLSNKQIAERLFLSPRTVGYHLHQVFPKLGVASRAALRDALGGLSGVSGPSSLDGLVEPVEPPK